MPLTICSDDRVSALDFCLIVAPWGPAAPEHAYLIENGRVVMSGTAEALRENPDIQEFYLGGSGRVDYRNVKHYRRRKRWLA